MLFAFILSLSLFWTYAVGQTPSASSTGPTPICLQPRKSSDPLPSAISAVLASAVPKACDPELQELLRTDTQTIRTYEVQSFNLNISEDATPTNQAASPSSTLLCPDAFRDIISTCIESTSDAGFWGGWIILESSNYSISDFAYPKNALLSATSLASIPAASNPLGIPTASGQTGSVPSGSATVSQGTAVDGASGLPGTIGGSASSGSFGTATNGESDGPPTGTFTGDQSGPLGTTTDGGPSGSLEPSVTGSQNEPSGTAANSAPNGSLEPTLTGDQSGPSGTADTSAPYGSLEPTLSRELSRTLGGSLPSTSNGLGGTAPTGTGGPQESAALPSTTDLSGLSGPSGSPFPIDTALNTAANSGTFLGASSALGSGELGNTASSGSSFGSGQTGSNGIPTQGGGSTTAGVPTIPSGPTPGAQGTASQINSGFSQASQNSGEPSMGGSQVVSEPGPSNGTPDPTNPGGNTITPPPVIIPTTPIDRDSPQATSNGFIIGGLLSDLSKSAKSYSNEITIPATKTAFLDDIDDTENQLETLFKDMGGTLPPDTGGCSSGARKQKRAIGDLIGDVFNTVRCAINSVDTLKSHVDIPEPDLPTIEGDLDDIGSLSENIDSNTENDNNDDGDSSTKEDQQSTKQPSTKEEGSTQEPSTQEPSTTLASTNEATTTGPSSTIVSSSMVSSTRASSSDPCLGGAITTGAGGLVKRATADSCDYQCPSPIPAAPTSGSLAITPGEVDDADAQAKHRRDIAGRVRLQKRAKGPIAAINNCQLLTPSNPAQPVTTPDYPGGFAFWQSETNGVLPQSFQAISRYYRTTDGANAQCAPTVTAVPANALTPNRNDQNEIVSVDHAYENGWLQGFFESIIDPPNPVQPALSCAAANAIFFNQYPGAPSCAVNRMAPIYDALASNTNPDFVVMSQWLNGDAKGWIMGPTFDENDGEFFDNQWKVGGGGLSRWNGADQARDSITYKLGHLKNILLGCLMINADNVIPLIQRTNNRVYKAFQSLDTSLQGTIYQGSDFAGRYRAYMEDRATHFNKAPNLVTRMIDNIQTDLQAAAQLTDVDSGERGSLALLLASYKSLYTIGNNANQWQYQVTFEWDTNNVRRDLDGSALLDFNKLRRLVERQEDGDSCPLTAPASASLPAASGFATGGGSNGGGGGGQTASQTGEEGTASATGPGPKATPAPSTEEGPASTTAPDADPTTAAPPESSSSSPTSCQEDADCKDFVCSSGDPFCAIAISKVRLRHKRQDDTPTPTTAAPASFPTGFCGCRNQDPPASTSTGPESPAPSGCEDGGTFADFDECSANCAQGYCQENAGQPQITCSCN
ncbi:MAG: hypothetical protein Q9188_007310 [Gyalolechia gomerana]